MHQKHEHLKAYILHTRPYRETSLLIDCFTEQLGRYSAIAKGAYRGKSPTRVLLQPFNLLNMSLQGRTELLTLTYVEREGVPLRLEGQALVCGLYLNELLVYTLHRHDPHPRLFRGYQQVLFLLSFSSNERTNAIALREFEFVLLEELGYGFRFDQIKNEANYFCYEPLRGFQLTHTQTPSCFSSKILKGVAAKTWDIPEVLMEAKRLTRLALMPLLNGKEIRSRELL